MGVGEQIERAQRRRFWLTLGAIGATGIPLGFFIGFNAGHHDVGIEEAAAMIPPAMLALAAVAYALAMTVGTWLFNRSIDEVERADNLWASAAAYYAYVVAFPCWWLLGKGGYVTEPNDWILFATALIVGLAAYVWRKWRAR